MESKKINQLATELTPVLSDLTIIGDPTTGISKKITLSQMASLFTGTVEEYPNLASFPLVGVADTIYIALDTNVLYRWNTGTNAYVELSPNIINSLVFNDANGFDGTISLVGSVATLTITTALTTGSVGFIGASGALLQDNSNFFWDDSNNRLGIGTNAPTTAIDAFGSGIITRVNGTSTNNAFVGFASAGTNKWSIGNVQSDHRFRIYNDATTSELVSVLQTGEFGIGIANPTTKFHIDGGASALIANLDANVSVAKSVSFRSDNSNRINLEVSGTESGSNAGANFFLRTYTDLGALIETPFQIVRSTGVTTIKSLTLTNALSVANGGTGSTTQNFVDLTTTQSIGGAKTFTSALSGTSATFSSTLQVDGNASMGAEMYRPLTSSYLRLNGGGSGVDGASVLMFGSTHPTAAGRLNLSAVGSGSIIFSADGATRLTIASTGAATFSSSVTATSILLQSNSTTTQTLQIIPASGQTSSILNVVNSANTINLLTVTSGGNVIMNGGNVGIGTSTVNVARLEVVGGITSLFTIDSAVNSATYGGSIFYRTTNTLGNGNGLVFSLNDSASSRAEYGYIGGIIETNTNGSHNGAIMFAPARSGARTEAMRITSGGNVGIGTSSPDASDWNGSARLLHIYQNTTNGSVIKLESSNASGILAAFNDAMGVGTLTNDPLLFYTNVTERMRILSGGSVAIGDSGDANVRFQIKSVGTGSTTYATIMRNSAGTDSFWIRDDGAGYLRAAAWSYGSDKRIKENINYIENGLDKVLALKPATFDYIDGVKNNVGWIAQDVQEVIPEAIGTISETNDQLTLKSDFIVPYLVKAIQEQQSQIQELKAKIK
jgi:hypothetical protein